MNRIRSLRIEKGYTQDKLAYLLKCSSSIIGLYESGRRNPSIEVLVKLSKIFDCSIDYIIGKSDIKNINELELDKLDIAFASGIHGLNKENKKTLKSIMDGLLAKQKMEDENK